MKNRDAAMARITNDFLKKLENNFPKDAFVNDDLLIQAFKGAEFLYDGEKKIKRDELNKDTMKGILNNIEKGVNGNYYDSERFKKTLSRDLSVSDDIVNRLTTVEILKTEAILFNIFMPALNEITKAYMNEDEMIDEDEIKRAHVLFKEKVNGAVLDKMYEAKVFQLPGIQELDRVLASAQVMSEVIDPPDNQIFLQGIEEMKKARVDILPLYEKGRLDEMWAYIDQQKQTFCTFLLERFDKINVPFQVQLDNKLMQLTTLYSSLAENENKSSPNERAIASIKNDIKNLEAEIDILKLKTKHVINAMEMAMSEQYNPYAKEISVDQIFLPKEYKTSSEALPIHKKKYQDEFRNALSAHGHYELLKNNFVTNSNERVQSAYDFINRPVTYADKNMNNALVSAYINAIESYLNKYPDKSELKEKFGNTFKGIFEIDLDEIFNNDEKRLKFIEAYPTRKFVELFNKTFDSLSDQIKLIDVFGVNDSTRYAQQMLSAELNKVKNDLIHLQENHILEPDYKKLVTIEDKKVEDINAYVENMKETQRELMLAHQKVEDTFSLAKNAKESLMDAVENEQQKEEQKNLTKKDKKHNAELQAERVNWKSRDDIFSALTNSENTIKNDTKTEEAFLTNDLLLTEFGIFLKKVQDQIKGKEKFFHTGKSKVDELKDLIQFLRTVRDENQDRSQRVPLSTVYIEILNDQKFRATLEDAFIGNQINEFIKATDNFTRMPLIPSVSAQVEEKVKGKKEKSSLPVNVNESVTNPIYEDKGFSHENPIYQTSNTQSNVDAEIKLKQTVPVKLSDEKLLEIIINKLTNKRSNHLTTRDPFNIHFNKSELINDLIKSLKRSQRDKISYEQAMKVIFSDPNLNKAYNKIMKKNKIISLFNKNKESLIKIEIDHLMHEQGRKSLDALQAEAPKPEAPKKRFFGGRKD